MMSPPCQPYTRKGKKEREKDARSTALAFIIDMFEDMDGVCDDIRPRGYCLKTSSDSSSVQKGRGLYKR